MNDIQKLINARFIITEINGEHNFRSFLLGHNLSIGSVFSINYSPRFAQLVSITVRQKILSLRKEDFEHIECIRIA